MFHVKHRGSAISQEILDSIQLVPGILERLDDFADLLLRWNRTVNLIARKDEAVLWDRHIADSLQLFSLVGPTQHAADLGSGGGFPGLVLAIATGIHFDLIESDQRKSAFLREAARITAADVTVYNHRIELAHITPVRLITARALAPLPILLDLAAPLLASGGVCLLLKGAQVDAELTASAARWHMRTERFPSRTSANASILRISEIEIVESPN